MQDQMIKVILSVFIISFSYSSFSEVFQHTGKVNRIGSILTRDDSDYVFLEGLTDAGQCPKSSGYVTIRIPNSESGNRAYSTILAAKLANKNVFISVDDNVRHPEDNGCMLRAVTLID